jgi:hypothetical protein
LWTAFHRHGIGPDTIIIHPDAIAPNSIAALPASPQLVGLYPNPFNPATTVSYSLPSPSAVTFSVYDVLGREVQHVALDRVDAGSHRLTLDLSAFSSGVYFISMRAANHIQTAKAVLMK